MITRVRLTETSHNINLVDVSAYTDDVVLTGIVLRRNTEGRYYLKMPTRYCREHSRYFETFHPLTKSFYDELLTAVVNAYERGDISPKD